MNIGLLRAGENYFTIEQSPVYSYKGKKIASVSQTNIETLRWDLKQHEAFKNHYQKMKLAEMISIFKMAGKLFAEEKIEMGSEKLGPEGYARMYSLSTGAPISVPLKMLNRIKDTFNRMEKLLEFQAMDGNIKVYEQGYTFRYGKKIGWVPRGRNLGVVTPSNHPFVNFIWTIACAMGYPVVLRPSLDDPFTPLRLINSLILAGMPHASFHFYPGPHTLVKEIVTLCDLSMIFGGPNMSRDYSDKKSVKFFGPGKSKIIIGEDYADRVAEIVDLSVLSMMKDGGRGCINLSAIITTKNARNIAKGIASKIASIEVADPVEEESIIGAFKNKSAALSINTQIESEINKDSIDVTASLRNSSRMIDAFGTTFLLPTVVLCRRYKDSLFGKEFPFPFITVTEVAYEEIIDAASGSLVVTLLSEDEKLYRDLLLCPDIAKVYCGTIPTTYIDFDEPHDGFISEFLFRTKALKGGELNVRKYDGYPE